MSGDPLEHGRTLPSALLALGLLLGVPGAVLDPAGTGLAAAVGIAGGLLALLILRTDRNHGYGAFALRMSLAAALLAGGALLLLHGTVLFQALGFSWLLGGAALAIGFLTPWSAIYAALALLIAVPAGGGSAWAGLAFASLALAFLDDDRLAVDRLLQRRGGLFPTLLREVVLEERGR